MHTTPPQCCNETASYVFISHQCQFYVCLTCKQEVYATPQLGGLKDKKVETTAATEEQLNFTVSWY